jgi:hypothetical protein
MNQDFRRVNIFTRPNKVGVDCCPSVKWCMPSGSVCFTALAQMFVQCWEPREMSTRGLRGSRGQSGVCFVSVYLYKWFLGNYLEMLLKFLSYTHQY